MPALAAARAESGWRGVRIVDGKVSRPQIIVPSPRNSQGVTRIGNLRTFRGSGGEGQGGGANASHVTCRETTSLETALGIAAGEPPGTERGLKIVAADGTVEVQDFPGQE